MWSLRPAPSRALWSLGLFVHWPLITLQFFTASLKRGPLETNEQDENGSFYCFQWCRYLIVRSIAVNDETRAQLMLRETSRNESHAEADKRVVPAAGTLGSLLCCVEEGGTLRLLGNESLEASAGLRPTAKHDPWELIAEGSSLQTAAGDSFR